MGTRGWKTHWEYEGSSMCPTNAAISFVATARRFVEVWMTGQDIYCSRCAKAARRALKDDEFLQLCTDQAKEQRAAGRLAIASALERYVERELTK